MKLAVVCSAGGGAIFEAFDMACECGLADKASLLTITDRPCGAEDAAASRGLAIERITTSDKSALSRQVAQAAKDFAAEAVLLAFSRMVGPELFRAIPTYNLHPSLLPEFPGLGATRQAREAEAKTLGATLHMVDEGMDTGPIVAQCWSAAPEAADDVVWNRFSFVHKTYLVLWLLEQLAKGQAPAAPTNTREERMANASAGLLNDQLRASIAALAISRGIRRFDTQGGEAWSAS